MKWFALVIIVLVVAGLVYARTRSTPHTEAPSQPHRLDDSVTPPVEPPAGADSPIGRSSLFAGTDEPQQVPEPGSDFATEPGITHDDDPDSQSDRTDPQGRPGA